MLSQQTSELIAKLVEIVKTTGNGQISSVQETRGMFLDKNNYPYFKEERKFVRLFPFIKVTVEGNDLFIDEDGNLFLIQEGILTGKVFTDNLDADIYNQLTTKLQQYEESGVPIVEKVEVGD